MTLECLPASYKYCGQSQAAMCLHTRASMTLLSGTLFPNLISQSKPESPIATLGILRACSHQAAFGRCSTSRVCRGNISCNPLVTGWEQLVKTTQFGPCQSIPLTSMKKHPHIPKPTLVTTLTLPYTNAKPALPHLDAWLTE